jgi:hypothetical protein
VKSYFEIFEILVKSLKSCEISYVILPCCGHLGGGAGQVRIYCMCFQAILIGICIGGIGGGGML